VSAGLPFGAYRGGSGGACGVFEPPYSFWCAGGGWKTGFAPSGVALADGFGHAANWSDPVADGAEVRRGGAGRTVPR
jgi:hypothetical protein